MGVASRAFTREQLEAIERRDGSLFLHANAGSGKTSVLVERFVRAARDDGADVERILAITFTEKAAAELKARIRARFLELGDRERARAAEGAWVSTIHGFCSRLLRTHPLAAGIDPEYRVLDQAANDRVGAEAFELALEDFLREEGWGPEWPLADRLELAASYRPDGLGTMVRTVHSRLRSMGEREPSLPGVEEPREGGERERLRAALRAAAASLRGDAQMPSVARELRKMERCRELLERTGAGGLPDPDELAPLEPKTGAAKALQNSACEELTAAYGPYLRVVTARRQFHDYRLLRELVRLYGEHYAGLKRERSGLDFEDLELMARDLLRDELQVREQYRERFQHVMVDEFQDTNRLQVELLGLIANGNLFTVGDASQSIYLFRNADVGVFRERRDAARAAGGEARLAANFRSRPAILDALNLAFEQSFGEEFEPLRVPEGANPEPPRLSPSVELLVADRSRGKNARWEAAFPDGLPFGSALSRVPPWRAAEARLLANRVRELAGAAGPFVPGDVAVLLRAATDIGGYERALQEAGLPTYVAGGRGYWSQQQVGDLRAYLSALANPLDELALLSLLASPLVGASVDAVTLVRLRAREMTRDTWWALEQAFCEDGDGSAGLADALSGPDRERIASFARRFADERRAAPRISLETLIDRALTTSGYDRRILALPGGERRMANVRKLMRLAREYEAEEGRDLRGFIDFIGEQDLVRAREGEAPLEAEGLDAVRLMTIHAAKGLEFPVVCVADLGREGRPDDDALRVTPDGRIGLKLASLGGGRQPGLELEAIKRDQDAEADAEERRVFYVAMTRAKEHLVLSGATDTEKWPEAKQLGAPIEWIWRALAPGLPDLCAESREAESSQSWDGREVRVRCVVCEPSSIEQVLPREGWAPEAAAPLEPPPAGVQPPLLAPVEASGALPVSRLSYSALERYSRCGYRFYLERVLRLRLEAPEEPLPSMPAEAPARAEPRPGADDELSPLLRGTIVHQLLERLDFARPAAPPAEEVRGRLESHGAPAGEAEVEDIRDLVGRFVSSDLCLRLAAARRTRQELPFAFTLRPEGAGGRSVLINGIVDVHAAEGEGTLIVDYKSDPLQGADPVAYCGERYETQRLVYALAALRSGAERVEVAYCFLERADEPVTSLFAQADLPRLERALVSLASGVVEGRFEPTSEPHRELCQFCAGRPDLCSWPPERTLADRAS